MTQIQALRACRNAGINVPPSTIKKADNYIFKCANRDGGISYSYRTRGRSMPAITAAACATMYNLGRFEHKVAVGALRYTKNRVKKSSKNPANAFGGHGFYGLLYFGQAMWFAGGKDWNWYFPIVRDYLLEKSRSDGSWRSAGLGSIFATSSALLTLQLPYRYLPVLQR